jgi:dihydrofolate reductase
MSIPRALVRRVDERHVGYRTDERDGDAMSKLVVTEFLTLDGVMEDPGGAEGFDRGGWSFKFPDPEGMKFKLEEHEEADAMLLGRVTYEGFAAAWPSRADDAGFAEKMNSMPKYVVSTTLTQADWTNSTVLGGNLVDEVAKLKRRHEVILVHGSRLLVHSLMRDDLVDECHLMVFPVVLGAGKRLFPEAADTATLELADSKALASGAVILTYRPRR